MDTVLIIFDIDGTLCDTVEADDSSFLKALKDLFDIVVEESLWQQAKEKTSGTDSGTFNEIFVQEYGAKPTMQDILAMKTHFFHLLGKHFDKQKTELIPGALKIFEDIKKTNKYKLAIATGGWEQSGVLKLNSAGFTFKDIPYANADSFLWRKDIISDAITKSKIAYSIESFSKIVYVGDGIWDFLSAIQLDIGFVGIDHHKTNVLKEKGAHYVINDFTDHSRFFSIVDSL